MATATWDRVLEEVKSLTAQEQHQLRAMLDRLLTEPQAQRRNALADLLLKQGVITRVPSRVASAALQNWQPVEANSKPVSQSIIEERR